MHPSQTPFTPDPDVSCGYYVDPGDPTQYKDPEKLDYRNSWRAMRRGYKAERVATEYLDSRGVRLTFEKYDSPGSAQIGRFYRKENRHVWNSWPGDPTSEELLAARLFGLLD